MNGDARQTWLVAAVALALGCGGSSAGMGADGACASGMTGDTPTDAQDADDRPSDVAAAPETATEVPQATTDAQDVADASPDVSADVTGGSSVDGAAASCTDEIRNGDETDVDCGGSCAPCGANKTCGLDADCSATASGCDAAHGGCRCDAISKRCVYDHCFDSKSDDGESGLDCGGDVCAVCGLGQSCRQDTDCSSEACDAISSKCIANVCSDHRQDRLETDVDCGGANSCPRCPPGGKCLRNGDCQAGHTCSTDGSLVCL